MTINFVISCEDGQYYVNRLKNSFLVNHNENWVTIQIGKINNQLMREISKCNPNKISIESPNKNILEYLNELSCDSISVTDPQLLIPVSRANNLEIYLFGNADLAEEYLLQFTYGNITKLIIYIANINKKLLDDIKNILDHYFDIVGAKKNAYDVSAEYFSKYLKQDTLHNTFGILITNENLMIGFSNDNVALSL